MNENQPVTETTSRRTERVVGAFVVLALLLLLAGFAYYLYHTAERKGWRVPRCPYYTYVASGEGLNVGDPVMLLGFNVGEITGITAQPPGAYYKVYVGFEIRRPYYGYVWSDSKVKITASGFLGNRRLEVATGYAGAPTVNEKNGRIHQLLVDGKYISFAEARQGVFIEPVEDPSVTERAQKLVSTVEQALPNILSLTNDLHTVLTNTAQLTQNANQIMADARPLVANLQDPHGSLGEWLIPTDLHTNLTAVTASLNETILNLAAITSNLNAQVESNDKMLSQISSLVVNTDALVQGLKKHWLLRGVFQKMNTQTNAPPSTTQPTEQRK
jgi:ABC-type transporter Mla subunit MlaD